MNNKTFTCTLVLLSLASVTMDSLYTLSLFGRVRQLDQCARSQNVYACKWVAQPVTPPQVIVQQAPVAMLLPPPVYAGGQ